MVIVACGEEHVVALAAREPAAALVFREVEEFVGERVVRRDGRVEVDALQGDALIFCLDKCLPVDGDAGGRRGQGVFACSQGRAGVLVTKGIRLLLRGRRGGRAVFLSKRHGGHASGNKCERARDGDNLHP